MPHAAPRRRPRPRRGRRRRSRPWAAPPPPPRRRAAPGPAGQALPARSSWTGAEIRRLPTTREVVALTFNAAWDEAGVEDVLAELRRPKPAVTFFPTGSFAQEHPAAVRAMAAAHGLGNHAHTHPSFDGLDTEEPPRRCAAPTPRSRRLRGRAAAALPLPVQRDHRRVGRRRERARPRGHRVHRRHQRPPGPPRAA
ncbi:polysaccharide deacetylase family protein [Streptomyces sp. NPDC048507]|uniref:polysaccharide deacetylase family protein n=1 Tax=Streptomyces sp. NPDC048507 TaxID=3365560 RepID=UPI0037188691